MAMAVSAAVGRLGRVAGRRPHTATSVDTGVRSAVTADMAIRAAQPDADPGPLLPQATAAPSALSMVGVRPA
jgi:hypothetical protein